MNIKRYIILADDDPDDRLLFEEAIKEVDYNTKLISSIDGAHLMSTLIATVPPKPDIIFLDINMPKKNGFECLEQIRLSPKLKDIPVIMYSTTAQLDAVNKAYKAGANFYVQKPDTFCNLKTVIEKVLSINFTLGSKTTSRDSFLITI
ncbi:MAG: response regulator [Bacteroidia bacterium]